MATSNQLPAHGRWTGSSSLPVAGQRIRTSSSNAFLPASPQVRLASNERAVAGPSRSLANAPSLNPALGTMRTAGPGLAPFSSSLLDNDSGLPPAAAATIAPSADSGSNVTSLAPSFFADWGPGLGTEHLHGKVGHPLGGIPTAHDFLPSLMFILLYTLLLAPVIMRVKTGMLTFGQLWRPLLAILLNIATYGVRIKLAEGHTWNKDTFIAEIVLMRLTPILLTSALVALFRHAAQPYLPSRDAPKLIITILLRHLVAMLQLATYFCLGLTLAIAFDVKQAINGSPEAHTKLHRSKEVCIYLLLVINISVWLLAIVPLVLLKMERYTRELVVTHTREAAKFMAILAVCTFLLVVTSYKAAQLASAGKGDRTEAVTNDKSVFYCVCVTAEFVACALLVCLSWARLVPPRELLEMHCRLRREAMQERELHGHPSIGWPTPPGQLPPHDTTLPSTRLAHGQPRVAQQDNPIADCEKPDTLFEPYVFKKIGHSRQNSAEALENDDDQLTAKPSRHSDHVLLSDPFGLEGEGDGNTTLTNARRDSAVTLSTISEVGETSPLGLCTPQGKFLQWARALTASPKPSHVQAETTHRKRKDTLSTSTDSLAGRSFQRLASNESAAEGGDLNPTLLAGGAGQSAPFVPAPDDAQLILARSRSGSAGDLVIQRMPPVTNVRALQPCDFRPRSMGEHHATVSGPLAALGYFASSGELPLVGGSNTSVRAAAHNPVLVAPPEAQNSSACSVRSHWSDDSDEERGEKSRGSLTLSRKKNKN